METGKWEGKAVAEVKGARSEKVWTLLEDFCGLNKWFPTLTTCIHSEGILGQPGCVRYCSGFTTPLDKDEPCRENWTKQQLQWIDRDQMALCYTIVDGNVGFNGYVSTMKVVQIGEGCGIHEVEPPKGWRHEDLDSFVKSGLQVMGQRMGEFLQASSP